VIAVEGELDLATADEFTAGVRRELAGAAVVLDLSGLSFVDSSGVRALDDLVRETDREGWALSIDARLPEGVRQVLRLTGMLDLLPIEADPGSG
jgi:anti-sigma B factor antagonist